MDETLSADPGLPKSRDRQVCVLLVEDDPALQRMIVSYFAENNIRTLVASSRQEMVRQIGIAEVNLVILDLRLGQEDGLDLLREIRASSPSRSLLLPVTAAMRLIEWSGSAWRRRLSDKAFYSARIARARPRGAAAAMPGVPFRRVTPSAAFGASPAGSSTGGPDG